jgi:hypothetical protein
MQSTDESKATYALRNQVLTQLAQITAATVDSDIGKSQKCLEILEQLQRHMKDSSPMPASPPDHSLVINADIINLLVKLGQVNDAFKHLCLHKSYTCTARQKIDALTIFGHLSAYLDIENPSNDDSPLMNQLQCIHDRFVARLVSSTGRHPLCGMVEKLLNQFCLLFNLEVYCQVPTASKDVDAKEMKHTEPFPFHANVSRQEILANILCLGDALTHKLWHSPASPSQDKCKTANNLLTNLRAHLRLDLLPITNGDMYEVQRALVRTGDDFARLLNSNHRLPNGIFMYSTIKEIFDRLRLLFWIPPNPQAEPEDKPEDKPETKPEVKPETKPEAKPEDKLEAPVETKLEAPVETKLEAKPAEAPMETKLEAPVETKLEAKPAEAPMETKRETPMETKREAPMETKREARVEPSERKETIKAPTCITKKNKEDDIEAYFEDCQKAQGISFWQSKLESAIDKQGTHIVEAIFARVPKSSLTMTMEKKLHMLKKSLESKKADMARTLLVKFDLDVHTMQISCGKFQWGDLTNFDSALCQEFIERFDLSRACFSGAREILSIESMQTLQWVVQRFGLDKRDLPAHCIYSAVLTKLRHTTPEEFCLFMNIAHDMVMDGFRDTFVNEHDNILIDCIVTGRLPQFNYLKHLYKLNAGVLQKTFRVLVKHTSTATFNKDTIQTFLDQM